ncbi:phosphoglycerate dehydrogenase [Labrys wisconsinensis]|uniref:Phosphoglycerate dehydrogenase-like enzyme n=1 Tax=Labrys wisconsinensis TaxID=425677 RepID=A0ABU0JL71_9HYPH|nr:phosphoglycerate dehydrogenase [Labrys wisconsinensis]MDQ0473999.1 phosphoglycerate dehydrogenase-like enzyme [Labrys wisconsinensis]
MSARIFVSWPGYSADDPETGGRLVAAGHELILAPKLGARSEDELIALSGDAVGAIVSTDPFTARVLAANPRLRIIARIGVGTDSIDAAAAARHGVAVSITPGMNAEPVADQTLALILALIRRVVPQDGAVKAGRWDRVGAHTPSELPGKTVGLVGAGTIGRAVARRLRGFDVSIVYFDRQAPDLEGARRLDSLEDLLAVADIVSLHAPLLPETRHLIDAPALARMKPTALLINTARGPLVDTSALFEALRRGTIAGAGLDVFEEEPPGEERLAGIPNLVCSAHIGGLSHESIRRMTISATDSVLAVLGGAVPPTVINPEVLGAGGGRAGS